MGARCAVLVFANKYKGKQWPTPGKESFWQIPSRGCASSQKGRMSHSETTILLFPMKIEHITANDLIPYARNSRTHSPEQVSQIAGSIREFGFTNPILIDGEQGIIAGHGRLMAARKLGMTEVPCIRLDHLTDAQKRAYIIADNKLALNAGWDEEMLSLELADLHEMDFDLDLTGFNANEIEAALVPQDVDSTNDDAAKDQTSKPCPHCGKPI